MNLSNMKHYDKRVQKKKWIQLSFVLTKFWKAILTKVDTFVYKPIWKICNQFSLNNRVLKVESSVCGNTKYDSMPWWWYETLISILILCSGVVGWIGCLLSISFSLLSIISLLLSCLHQKQSPTRNTSLLCTTNKLCVSYSLRFQQLSILLNDSLYISLRILSTLLDALVI